MKILPFLLAAAAFSFALLPASAQKMQTPAGEAPGPWILGTIGVGKQTDGSMKAMALKGIAIKVGEHGEAAVAYDLDLCRMAGGWTGKFTTPMNLMSRGEFPTAMGAVAFTTSGAAGFVIGDAKEPWKDSRPEPFGPLPQGQARFKGFYVNGDRTILKWDIGGTDALEMPNHARRGDGEIFSRILQVAPMSKPLLIRICELPKGIGPRDLVVEDQAEWKTESHEFRALWDAADDVCLWRNIGDELCLEIPPHAKTATVSIHLGVGPKDGATLNHDNFYKWSRELRPQEGLETLLHGAAPRWPEVVETQGSISSDKSSAYAVDTIKLPDPNPWGAPMFVGGFDFFPDGRAAVCTFHGDVFIVSGIDAGLEHVTWKRFASGLYHALGLKIVNGEIYVTCRDGLWRLRDLNGDGECDFYEAFNNDIMVTKSFHEFVFDLQTDPQGNFYFAKAGPVKNGGRGFDEVCAHHGSMFRVSPDGKKFEVIATGFRAPNGMGVGPHGEITSGDNEGTWTPMCRLNWITPGGFYGVPPLSHRDPEPTDYDRPLCWMPKRVDNSSGGQVWVTSDKWGPWENQLLHLSYGTCSVFGVLAEPVPGSQKTNEGGSPGHFTMQGGVTRFPVNFQSGVMRARFNPADGQLYVAGLRGWQTTAVKNGCFQRVRYQPEVPVRMPIGLHATKRGVRIDFACPLDAESASDLQNWGVEAWNIIWSSAYGSPEISTLGTGAAPAELGKDGAMQFTKEQMAQKHHDSLTVKAAEISVDRKSVFLVIPEIQPVMQMSIKYSIQSEDKGEMHGEVVNTIHALGEAQ